MPDPKKDTKKSAALKDSAKTGKSKTGKNPTHQSGADHDAKYEGKTKKKDG